MPHDSPPRSYQDWMRDYTSPGGADRAAYGAGAGRDDGPRAEGPRSQAGATPPSGWDDCDDAHRASAGSCTGGPAAPGAGSAHSGQASSSTHPGGAPSGHVVGAKPTTEPVGVPQGAAGELDVSEGVATGVTVPLRSLAAWPRHRLAALALGVLSLHALARAIDSVDRDDLVAGRRALGEWLIGDEVTSASPSPAQLSLSVAHPYLRVERVTSEALPSLLREELAAGNDPIALSLGADVEPIGSGSPCLSGNAGYLVVTAAPTLEAREVFAHERPVLGQAQAFCFAYAGVPQAQAIADACGMRVEDMIRISSFPNALAPPASCSPGGSCLVLTLKGDDCREAIEAAHREAR